MSKNINFDLKALRPQLKKLLQRISKRAVFLAIIAILLAYLFMVWRISTLTSAEPSVEDETAALAETNIPRVNKNAVEHIQSLEQNSSEVKSLFDQARNNPFQE